ncbi:2985_t:CDS:1, partial [Dentiscutata erythropus]
PPKYIQYLPKIQPLRPSLSVDTGLFGSFNSSSSVLNKVANETGETEYNNQ